MAYLSPDAIAQRRRMEVPKPSFASSLGESLPGVLTRGLGTIGGAALGAGAGPVGMAAAGAAGAAATEPVAQGMDTAMAGRLADSEMRDMDTGQMSPMAAMMRQKRPRREWGSYLGGP